MSRQSAGILFYRLQPALEVLLVHPGGPFWKNKDAGAWSIPKGEIEEGEDPLAAAKREVLEETGIQATGSFIPLTAVRLKSGKRIMAWANEMNVDINEIRSIHFEMEWPPRSGKIISVPEVDKAEWFNIKDAIEKLNPAQAVFITKLGQHIRHRKE